MNIHNFKYGDIITRNETAKTNYGIDNSMKTHPFRFIAVNADAIHIEPMDGFFAKRTRSLERNNGWEEGWTYFVGARVPMPEFKGGEPLSKRTNRIVAVAMAASVGSLILSFII